MVAVMIAAVASLSRSSETAMSSPESVRPEQGLITGPGRSTTSTTVVSPPDTTPPAQPTLPPATSPAVVTPPVFVFPSGGAQTTPTTQPERRRYENGPTPPSVRIVSLEPAAAAPGQDVRLVFRAGDPDGLIIAWLINWGDGSTTPQTYDVPCTPDPSSPDHEYPAVTHRYREVGEYQITIRLVTRGACGFGPGQEASDQRNLTVGVPLPV